MLAIAEKHPLPTLNDVRMGICSTEAGFLVRLTDKLSRLSTFSSAGKLTVDNESYEDAIVDIINYCILFSAYTKGKSEQK